MKKKEIRVEEGTIVSFDTRTSRGVLNLHDIKVKFHSTCFQSTPPTRFPKIGEAVRVTFSHNILVSVRSEQKKQHAHSV